MKIEPVQKQIPIGSLEIPNFQLNTELYSSSNTFPETLYNIVGIYELKGYRILVLNLYPISYIPKTGQITYYDEMEVQVSLNEKSRLNRLFRGTFNDEKSIVNLIENPEILTTYSNKKSNFKRTCFDF